MRRLHHRAPKGAAGEIQCTLVFRKPNGNETGKLQAIVQAGALACYTHMHNNCKGAGNARQAQQQASTDADEADHLIAVACGPIFSFRGFPPRI